MFENWQFQIFMITVESDPCAAKFDINLGYIPKRNSEDYSRSDSEREIKYMPPSKISIN